MTMFTVFLRDQIGGRGWCSSGEMGAPTPLRELSQHVGDIVCGHGWSMVAWAPLAIRMSDDETARLLMDASIAAGRLIEFRDGKYIPLGVAEEAPKTAKSRPGFQYICEVPEGLAVTPADLHMVARDQRPPLTWATPKPFDPFGGFFTEPADIADWQDTYFPR